MLSWVHHNRPDHVIVFDHYLELWKTFFLDIHLSRDYFQNNYKLNTIHFPV
jgi:hypothetical protein